MYVRRSGSSMKQLAYARQLMKAEGINKKQIALDVGYSSNVANSVKSHIENKPGFNNAMSALARDSNNLALAAMHEFKARGFEDFSNKDLVAALNAIGGAWAKFNTQINKSEEERETKNSRNKLRTVILQQIENQTVNNGAEVPPPQQKDLHEMAGELEVEYDDPNDF